ncbi:MAG TPA: DMT family transporter [Bacteroidales bacterium]|jgi:drug/metabolite transporter (DMT)-like permease|nr:DMT family transporter [Bacteroidales bacterium]
MNNNLRIYGSVIFSMIFWAFSFIWFKLANKTFGPITIVFFRLVISVVLLSSYLYIKKKFIRIKREDFRFFLMLAVFEPFFYFLGESFGLTYVSATVGSVLISTIPVVAAIGAWIIFRERLRVINYIGIVLSFVGVLIFIINGDGTITYNAKGISLLMLAVISAAGYNLTLSRLVGSYSPVFIVNFQNLLGSVLFLPLFMGFELKHLTAASFSVSSLMPVIALAIFASCFAFILFAYSVRHMGVTRANVFTNFIPVFTAVFSFLILGDKLTLQNIAGMVIVISGLLMSQINGRKKKYDEALVLTGKTA